MLAGDDSVACGAEDRREDGLGAVSVCGAILDVADGDAVAELEVAGDDILSPARPRSLCACAKLGCSVSPTPLLSMDGRRDGRA